MVLEDLPFSSTFQFTPSTSTYGKHLAIEDVRQKLLKFMDFNQLIYSQSSAAPSFSDSQRPFFNIGQNSEHSSHLYAAWQPFTTDKPTRLLVHHRTWHSVAYSETQQSAYPGTDADVANFNRPPNSVDLSSYNFLQVQKHHCANQQWPAAAIHSLSSATCATENLRYQSTAAALKSTST